MEIRTDKLVVQADGEFTCEAGVTATIQTASLGTTFTDSIYCNDRLIPPVLATGSIPSPSEDLLGMIVFDSTLEVLKVCIGDAWKIITFTP